ncbi:hypothetical protein R83H12_00237 [Fibrobacteria bacterium R8-3-H12]
MDRGYIIELDYCENHIRVRLVLNKGVLQSVMFQYETLLNDEWKPVIRYDCAHGQPFHRDVIWPNGKKEKEFVDIHTLEAAAVYARQDLENRWQWYLDRYLLKVRR